MNRDQVLELLRASKAMLKERFGVSGVALFGSFARDQAAAESDVDVLVRFDAPPDWTRYFGAQEYLEYLLGRLVDLAMDTDVRAEIRGYVQRDAIAMCNAAIEPRAQLPALRRQIIGGARPAPCRWRRRV